jgi:hypothetical protein
MRGSLMRVAVASLLVLPVGAHAVDMKTALDGLSFPSDTVAKVEAGQFVEVPLTTATKRDLNVGIAFMVKQAPVTVVRMLDDNQVQIPEPGAIAAGNFTGDGAPEQLAALHLTPAQLKAFSNAKPGDDLNLSSQEMAALNAAGTDPNALQEAVRAMLLARYRAYHAKGLAGIAPYAREGSTLNPADDLAKVDRIARETKILPASFCDVLENYPQNKPPDFTETLSWSQFTAHGEDTIALVHHFAATIGGTPVRVQRQYYASTGYNVEQSITGFLPLEGGTLVIYTNHTSTDQVEGFGGSAKRGIGRQVMAGQLERIFAKARAEAP